MTILEDLYPLLNADWSYDLVWWTEAELVRYLEDASRTLGLVGAFTEWTECPVTATDPVVPLALQTLSVIHASLDGTALRPANFAEMEALSASWEVHTGTVGWFLVNTNNTVRLYRVPATDGTLAVIHHSWPTIGTSSVHRGPYVLSLYLRYMALAAARSKDSDGAAADIAGAARERAGLIAAQARHLWGGAQ